MRIFPLDGQGIPLGEHAYPIREIGEDCGFDWCNTDHSKEDKSFVGHHEEACFVYVWSGSCDCNGPRRVAGSRKCRGSSLVV